MSTISSEIWPRSLAYQQSACASLALWPARECVTSRSRASTLAKMRRRLLVSCSAETAYATKEHAVARMAGR